MKKTAVFILQLVLAACLGPADLRAQGTVSQSVQALGLTGNYALTFTWTGDPSTGAVPITPANLAQASAIAQGYRLLQVETIPGSPAPTNGYSIAIADFFGGDMMGGSMSAVSSAAPQFFSATSASPPINGTFSLMITGQSVAGAKGKTVVYFGPTTLVNATAGVPGPAGPAGASGPPGTPGAPGGGLNAGAFTFTQTPSGTLSAGGGATVTLAPVPSGVNGTDASHYLYISSCSGGAQAVLITGGTAVSGAASGTVTFTPTNSCTAGWTIQSATAGIQEALQSAGANANVVVPPGVNAIFANIIFPFGSVKLYGIDRATTTIQAANATNLNQMTGSGSNSQISISGITFDGNFINQSSGNGYGVTFGGGAGYHVFGCAFKNFGIAFPAQSVSVALFVANGSDINFHDNQFNSDWGYDIQISGNPANPYQYRGVRVQHNQFGAASVTQSNTNVNYWDSQAAGNISTYVFHMADVVFSGNEVNGAPPNPSAGIPVYIGNCYDVVVNGNLVNGMGNGVGTISVANGSGAITGVNTGWDFTASIRSVAGGFLLIEGDATLYKISSASSATALVVTPTVVRANGTGLRYKISQANDMLGIVGDEGVSITGNVARFSRDNGISVGGNPAFVIPAHYSITGNTSEFNKTAGLLISGTFFSSSITGNTFMNNGQGFGTPGAGAAGFFSGIFVASDVSNSVQNNIISGNLLGDDQVSPTQQYGITVQDAHTTLNVLGVNFFRGNVQGDIEPTFKLTAFASDGLTGILGPLSFPFASLPTVPAAGYYVYCNNCTTAATCAGAGSGHMAVSNGANWTCQ